jgi:ATP-dependent RNA helicase RhlE
MNKAIQTYSYSRTIYSTSISGKDLIGCAQTGTGKTAAFAIPIIHQLHRIVGSSKKAANCALVVTPTRELAVKLDKVLTLYHNN